MVATNVSMDWGIFQRPPEQVFHAGPTLIAVSSGRGSARTDCGAIAQLKQSGRAARAPRRAKVDSQRPLVEALHPRMLMADTRRLATNCEPDRQRLPGDFRARRRALAIDECSDEDGQRLTIRISQCQGQRVPLFFHRLHKEPLE